MSDIWFRNWANRHVVGRFRCWRAGGRAGGQGGGAADDPGLAVVDRNDQDQSRRPPIRHTRQTAGQERPTTDSPQSTRNQRSAGDLKLAHSGDHELAIDRRAPMGRSQTAHEDSRRFAPSSSRVERAHAPRCHGSDPPTHPKASCIWHRAANRRTTFTCDRGEESALRLSALILIRLVSAPPDPSRSAATTERFARSVQR